MAQNLILDIGNTKTKIAVFEGHKELLAKSVKKFLVKDLKQLTQSYNLQSAIYASVVHELPAAIQHIDKRMHLIKLEATTRLPIKVKYKTPKTLGRDRIAAAVGGHAIFAKSNVLVIDLGTCIKYDYVTKSGDYIGGNIAPGMYMRIKSMHDYTDKLPLVTPKYNSNMLGQTTHEALENGVIWGIKSEIEGFIKTLTKKYGKFKVILSGGDAQYFADLLESKIFVAPNLVLIGLNEILMHNQ